MCRRHSDVCVRPVGCARLGVFLQWMLAKLFLTVETFEERQLICFSKRDRGEHKQSWLEAAPQESGHVVFLLLDVVSELTQRLHVPVASWSTWTRASRLALSTSILLQGTGRKGPGDTNTR